MSDKGDLKNNYYIMFTILSSIVALATLWNIRETHKIRKLQKKELEDKIASKENENVF